MDKLDQLILETVAERVFTPGRVEAMLKEFRERLKNARSKHDDQLGKLKKELDAVQAATDRLYEAVENGFLPMDVTLKERVHKHQARRQEILTEMAGLRRQGEMPLSQLGPKKIEAFCKALKEKLQDRSTQFGKEYLRLLVEEIRVEGKEIRIRGNYAALAGMLDKTKAGFPEGVPAFGRDWLPNPDSNQGQGG